MSKFTILLGGDLVRTPVLDDQVAGTRVIAADSGIRHAQLLDLTPELWVGDFDSVPENLPRRLQSVPRQKFPAEKDKTDGELAIDIAREKGASELILAGAFGGLRADHAFLHLALAVRLAQSGVSVLLTSGAQEGVPLLNRSMHFDYAEGTMFSILGFSDLDGLTVEGAGWPRRNVKVPFGSSLTMSKVVAGKLRS